MKAPQDIILKPMITEQSTSKTSAQMNSLEENSFIGKGSSPSVVQRAEDAGAQHPHQRGQGQADDIVEIPLDLAHQQRAFALDAVSAGLVQRFAGGDVPIDQPRL